MEEIQEEEEEGKVMAESVGRGTNKGDDRPVVRPNFKKISKVSMMQQKGK